VTKNVAPSTSQRPANPSSSSQLGSQLRKFGAWLFCPYRRVLIKIVPHRAESIYKVELSHLHLALAGITTMIVCAVLLVAHVADVRAAEARMRALQAVETRQRQELSVFSKQTTILWQRVGKLQRDNDEIHRLTRVIVPKAKAPAVTAPRKAATGTQRQVGFSQRESRNARTAGSPLSLWKKMSLWLHSIAGLDSFGFTAEAAQLSSLTNAVDETGQQTAGGCWKGARSLPQ